MGLVTRISCNSFVWGGASQGTVFLGYKRCPAAKNSSVYLFIRCRGQVIASMSGKALQNECPVFRSRWKETLQWVNGQRVT